MRNKDTSERKEPFYTKKITAYPWEMTLDQIDALARQRRREQPADLQRLAMHIGALFISIQGERGTDGFYGLWSMDTIQEQIRSWVAIGNDWLTEQGRPLTSPGADGSFTALLQVLMQGGHSFRGIPSEQEHWEHDKDKTSPSTNLQEGNPLALAKDFVPDATIGADLNLDETEIL